MHTSAGMEASVFDTQYDVQWVADGQLSGEAVRMPRTDLFRKKPVVTKPMLKAWIAEVAACENIQVCALSKCLCTMKCADSVITSHAKLCPRLLQCGICFVSKDNSQGLMVNLATACWCSKAMATELLIIHKLWT